MTPEAPARPATGPAPQRSRGTARRGALASVLPTTALWLLALAFAFPLLWFLLSSFKPGGELFTYPLSLLPREWTAEGYGRAWAGVDFARYAGNTLLVATITTALTVLVSAATGYALAKYRAKWLSVLFVCILATTMLPTEVILSPTFAVVRQLDLYNTLAGIVVPSIVTATGIFMFRQFFQTVPDELLHAARIDGAGEFGIFFRIMLPISRPILLTLAIFSFQWRWNDYIWPLIVLNDPEKYTIQVALRSLVGAENIDWTLLLPASVISMVPLALIFVVFQRYVIGADLGAGLKD
ncbi:carbohydrate ABC transporter permease [Kineococcus sp. SYSU DK005]|uniref:carbohydrate ABC transporter permease n=1 Tax=Kineococcus sp. SYSU DK005 TaxID=3383126 RepID=UPI003D7EE4F8